MKIPEVMNRDELSRTLWGFRYEFMVAGVFSLVANLLMLTPTIYMLQVYDRVMLSQSTGTLIAVSLITLFFFGVLTFAEWSRSKLLVSSGVRLDSLLSKRLFHASYEAYLNPEEGNPSRAFVLAGLGFVLPKSNVTLNMLGRARHDEFHLAGYSFGAGAGVEVDFWKNFFSRANYKLGYVNLPDVVTSSQGDKASHSFTFNEFEVSFGWRF